MDPGVANSGPSAFWVGVIATGVLANKAFVLRY